MRIPFSSVAPPRLHPVACAALLVCANAWAQPAAQDTQPSLKLKTSPSLQEKFTPEQKKGLPTFVFGDNITGRSDLETVVEGQAEIRRSSTVISADRIEYYQPDDLAKARGNARMNRDGNVYEGAEGEIKVDSLEGYFLDVRYQMLKSGGHGQATRADFLDTNRSVLRNADYTTCRREPEGGTKPDWIIRASQVNMDTDTDVGEATNGRLEFKGIPILGSPFLTFPLSDARKSGWLPPSINIDNLSGLEVVVPYYANLAPNRDLTVYPGIMTRRGVNVGAEFRYLEANYRGTARLDLMPQDRLRSRSRWGLTTSHTGTLATAYGSVGTSLSLNRASDDDYWRDFPRATGSLTQRLLPNDGSLNWSSGFWTLNARALKWQTLQQIGSVIAPPYDRLPQLQARYSRSNHNQFDYSLELDTTRFRSVSALTLQPNAQRNYALAQISRPMVTAGTFLTPKLQLHTSSYQFDAPLGSGPLAGQRNASRVVPTFSLDSGLIFERNTRLFGRNLTQTLEPRAFYTYTPFRNQSSLPIYDTGANDFNFSTVFTENAFTGQDRISDNNLLTLGLSSRFLDPASGAELMRLSYAQRLRLNNQQVTLPGGLPDTARLSDMLFGGTLNWSRDWQLDGTVQYNPKTRLSQRSTLAARYSPSDYRTLSATYRSNRDVSEQIDAGWQWPLNDLWGDKGKNLGAGQGLGDGRLYSVGRLNYSLKERRLVDTLIGLEYDAGCWLMRLAFERLQTTTTTANKRILFQMEFVGFARVGSNPLGVLKTNVPRYQLLREKITVSPSRFSNYD